MAHRILGIDLGSYSVKLAVADVGFRKVTVTHVLEALVPEGDDLPLERSLETARRLIDENDLGAESVCLGVGGENVSMRVLDFPFSGIKRADLDKAVGAELEGELPHDLEDIVFDFEAIPMDAVRKALTQGEGDTEEEPLHAAAGTRVLACASTVDRMADLMGTAAAQGIEPRTMIVASTVYPHVAGQLSALAGANLRQEPVLVIDIGHHRSNLCLVWGERPVFCRTVSRGGYHLTEAIARAWQVDMQRATQAKHSDGFVASVQEPAPSESWANVSAVLTKALAPLVRNLRQTMGACQAATGVVPTQILLCGGGSRLRGLASYLGEELGVPVGHVVAEDARVVLGGESDGFDLSPDTGLVAHGLALEGASSRPRYDLRKGPLAYKADLSVLRDRAGALAAAALLIMAFAGR